MIIVIIKLYIT